MLFEQLLPVDPDQQVQVPEAGLELVAVVPLQVLCVVVEQVLQEVEVLERFDNGREDEGNPAGVVAVRVVLDRQAFEDLLPFQPAAGQGHLVAVLGQFLVLLADVDYEEHHLVEEVLLVGFEQVDDERVPEERLREGLVLVLEGTDDFRDLLADADALVQLHYLHRRLQALHQDHQVGHVVACP